MLNVTNIKYLDRVTNFMCQVSALQKIMPQLPHQMLFTLDRTPAGRNIRIWCSLISLIPFTRVLVLPVSCFVQIKLILRKRWVSSSFVFRSPLSTASVIRNTIKIKSRGTNTAGEAISVGFSSLVTPSYSLSIPLTTATAIISAFKLLLEIQ